jgi:HK97 gp10 family phage protein
MAGKVSTKVGVKVVSNRLSQMSAEIKKDVAAEIERSARTIEAGAKQDVAVDTGTLRRSITTQIEDDGLSATVAAGTDYAIFVERGSRGGPARPFLIPNFEREVPRLRAAIKKAIG